MNLPVLIQRWDPANRPIHCTNCVHAKVSGYPEAPSVRCDEGHGTDLELVRMLRTKYAAGFRPADKCRDFEGAE